MKAFGIIVGGTILALDGFQVDNIRIRTIVSEWDFLYKWEHYQNGTLDAVGHWIDDDPETIVYSWQYGLTYDNAMVVSYSNHHAIYDTRYVRVYKNIGEGIAGLAFVAYGVLEIIDYQKYTKLELYCDNEKIMIYRQFRF